MRTLLVLAAVFFSVAAGADPAKVTVLEGGDVARAIVAAAIDQEPAAGDARVGMAQGWLRGAAKAYGEDEKAVAAHCERSARWFFDITRSRATALEMLEAIAVLAKPGVTLQDAMRTYIEARRATPGKSHAEALAKLGVASR